jgi:hypothetical protein
MPERSLLTWVVAMSVPSGARLASSLHRRDRSASTSVPEGQTEDCPAFQLGMRADALDHIVNTLGATPVPLKPSISHYGPTRRAGAVRERFGGTECPWGGAGRPITRLLCGGGRGILQYRFQGVGACLTRSCWSDSIATKGHKSHEREGTLDFLFCDLLWPFIRLRLRRSGSLRLCVRNRPARVEG